MTTQPRAKTAEEVREEFLDHLRTMTKYWAELPSDMKVADRLDGLAFSVLNMFDGTTSLPLFNITVEGSPEDKQEDIDEGRNWYEPGTCINDDCLLHDLWYRQ